MELYVQQSTFVEGFRVRTQDDERGRFVNVHCDGAAGSAYISLTPGAAQLLVDELTAALLALDQSASAT